MQRTSKSVAFAIVAGACAIAAGCKSPDAKNAWNDVVKNCAKSDLNGKTILYFGPSNNVGPASIWRKADQGGYRLRWTLSDLPGVDAAIQPGSEMTCAGDAKRDFSGKASLGLLSNISPVTGDLGGEFGRARKITVTAESMAWDTLKEGPFEVYVDGLSEASPIKKDLDTNMRLVAVRALRVHGFSADLEFDSNSAATLKAKYNGGLPAGTSGEVSAGFEGKWTSETNLKISAKDFYIAGELGEYKSTGFAAASGRVSDAVDVEQKAVLSRDPN